MDVTKELEEAIKTTQARHVVYGDSYLIHGEVLKLLFPEGFIGGNEVEMQRFVLLNMIITKLIRYCCSLQQGKIHTDSTHDLGVYAFMLQKHDEDLENGVLLSKQSERAEM